MSDPDKFKLLRTEVYFIPEDGSPPVLMSKDAKVTEAIPSPDAAALPPFSLDDYVLDRDPDESDEEYEARRAMFITPRTI
ncbi:hypothetical protein FIU28_17450 [Tardiphaga sp. vice154]|uniref:hypothetical protein n=1 Tax=Tardiphaga sp. vice154 TaxID=2592814 RepID=UPI001165849D|nr:hypothetical protein [Tardiphaga sp. vice154]QDM22738.1 hypothetical protein FIU28_17450 [Tardiphaga sp. vice154]